MAKLWNRSSESAHPTTTPAIPSPAIDNQQPTASTSLTGESQTSSDSITESINAQPATFMNTVWTARNSIRNRWRSFKSYLREKLDRNSEPSPNDGEAKSFKGHADKNTDKKTQSTKNIDVSETEYPKPNISGLLNDGNEQNSGLNSEPSPTDCETESFKGDENKNTDEFIWSLAQYQSIEEGRRDKERKMYSEYRERERENRRSALQAFTNAMQDKMRRHHEIAVVQAAQHIASNIRAHLQGHIVNKWICIVNDCKLPHDGNDCALPEDVKRLSEVFDVTIKESNENMDNEDMDTYDLAVLYVLQFGGGSRLSEVLEPVRRYSDKVPWLVVIQMESDCINAIEDYPNSSVIATQEAGFISNFNDELRFQSDVLDVWTIGITILNRAKEKPKEGEEVFQIPHLKHSWKRKVYLQKKMED